MESFGELVGSAGDGRHQQNTISFFDRAFFAAEKADVLFVEINIQKLANLALIVTDMAPEPGELREENIQGFSNRACATVQLWCTFGETTEGCGDFDCHCHVFSST